MTVKDHDDGDAKWYFDEVAVTAGEKYQFSDYYKSDVDTYVDVRYTLKDGSYLYDYLGTATACSDWKQFSIVITVPADVVAISVFHIIEAEGTLTVDNFSLTSLSATSAASSKSSSLASSLSSSKSSSLTSSAASSKSSVASSVSSSVASSKSSATSSVNSSRSSTNSSVASSANSSRSSVNSSVASSRSSIASSVASSRSSVQSSVASSRSSIASSVASSASSSTPSAPNLILNASLETPNANGDPANWIRGGFGINDATFTYPAEAQQGARGASITITTYTDGDAKWYFDDVAVTAGQEYRFSNFYKSSGPTAVVLRFTYNDGTNSYSQIAAPVNSSSWTEFIATFTAPANAISVTAFHLIQGIGTLNIDNFSIRPLAANPGDLFPQGFVTLTFDDGWTSHYTQALPKLNAAGLKGSFYIITNESGNADPANINNPASYLDYGHVQEIATAGHEVSAHTRTHASLINISQSQATTEVQGSRTDLLNEGFSPVNTFVYPYGEYNNSVIQIVKNAGFIGARGVEAGYNTKATDKYALKDQNVLVETTVDQMKSWVNTAMANKTWVIFTFHQVDNSGDAYSTTPAKLEELVNYLKNQNIPVKTLQEGLEMMP